MAWSVMFLHRVRRHLSASLPSVTLRRRIAAAVLPLPILLACDARSQPEALAKTASPGWAWYQNYCSGCHGREAQGGSGGALQPGKFKHGGTPEALFASIHDGIALNGMPAFGERMDDAQIRQIVEALLEPEKRTVESRPPAAKAEDAQTIRTLDYSVRVETWVGGLDVPWGISFVAPDLALVTEKRGTLRAVVQGELQPEPVAGTPPVADGGQGGLMDVEPHPQYASNGWIYLSFSDPKPSGRGAMTKVVRGRIRGGAWADQETIFDAPAESYSGGGNHFGSRLRFGPDGMLYFSIGERGNGANAQNLGHPGGKVHRVTPEGQIPPDNPFVGREGALPSIWSWGHRNPQGLAFHPMTGDLWESEHGPRGGDELNIARRSLNYGWPEVSYGINYNGSILTRERVRPGIEQPIWFWRPSIAVCGIEFYTGAEFPYWRNHLLVASLANQTLRLLHVEEGRVLHEETILRDMGRIRDATTGPDGAVYAVMNDPHRVLRLSSLGEDLQ